MSVLIDLIDSWANRKGNVNTIEDVLKWIEEKNSTLRVSVEKIPFSYNGFWHYDEESGVIRNVNDSFFSLAGYQEIDDDIIVNEQPVIVQNEIGYLGILVKKIDGVLNFLMQAKIEPGNINKIQISPTLQATKSNFTRMHGGGLPKYLEYFINTEEYTVLVDQVQSEQSSRFWKKRNRNMIVLLSDDDVVIVDDSHMWMTLGQIKELMKTDNLVNMDTRTVLSCIPFCFMEADIIENDAIQNKFSDKYMYKSLLEGKKENKIINIFSEMNNYKMYARDKSRFVPLTSLKSWEMTENEIVCKQPYDFKVIFCHIEIEGREVRYWEQPLIEALGAAVFGLFTCVEDGVRKYLVKIKPEVGCFDHVEVGPSVQMEYTNRLKKNDEVEALFLEKLANNDNIVCDVLLSEEGGRFYCEQNRNAIINIKKDEIQKIPDGYFWVTLYDLNLMIQFNNCINIQLRNLYSLIDLI